jgi:hypothetical protein
MFTRRVLCRNVALSGAQLYAASATLAASYCLATPPAPPPSPPYTVPPPLLPSPSPPPTTLYHGWASPFAGCSTSSWNLYEPTVMGGYYPYNAGDTLACRAWKVAATVCNTQPTSYSDSTNWQCPNAGGFSDPTFGSYCYLGSTQYSCSTCPGSCNAGAGCTYDPLSLRNCNNQETQEPPQGSVAKQGAP